MAELKPIVYNGNRYHVHTREDIAVIVKAYNLAVVKINQLEERLKKLEQEVQHD